MYEVQSLVQVKNRIPNLNLMKGQCGVVIADFPFSKMLNVQFSGSFGRQILTVRYDAVEPYEAPKSASEQKEEQSVDQV